MIARPRTWRESGCRSVVWGRFYLDTCGASPRAWEVRRHRLGWWVQAGGRCASIGRHAALIGAMLVALVAIAGCSGRTPVRDSSAVCVTEFGHVRVDDYRCEGSSMAYDWWYLAPGLLAPAIGQRATVGSLTRPPGRVRLGGVPATPTTTTKRPTTATKKTTTKKQTPTQKKAKPAAPKPKPAAPKVRTR